MKKVHRKATTRKLNAYEIELSRESEEATPERIRGFIEFVWYCHGPGGPLEWGGGYWRPDIAPMTMAELRWATQKLVRLDGTRLQGGHDDREKVCAYILEMRVKREELRVMHVCTTLAA